MGELLNAVLTHADYFVLLLVRVAGLVLPSPIFGRVGVPQRVKTGFVFFMTLLFFVMIPPKPVQYDTLLGFAWRIFSEMLLGVALAFVTNLFFTIAFTAGQMIDMQIGFGIVNVYDQQNNTQIPLIGNMLNIILLVVFMLVDGPSKLIAMLHRTLTVIPVGTPVFSPNLGPVALELFAKSFLLGVMMALPIIASGMVLEICYGVLIRTVPQMNMFVVGVPLKTLIGFFILLVTVPMFVGFTDRVFNQLFLGVDQMFAAFVTLA